MLPGKHYHEHALPIKGTIFQEDQASVRIAVRTSTMYEMTPDDEASAGSSSVCGAEKRSCELSLTEPLIAILGTGDGRPALIKYIQWMLLCAGLQKQSFASQASHGYIH